MSKAVKAGKKPTTKTTKAPASKPKAERKKCLGCEKRKALSAFGVQKRANGREVVKARCNDCLAAQRREAEAAKRAAAEKAAKAAQRAAKRAAKQATAAKQPAKSRK